MNLATAAIKGGEAIDRERELRRYERLRDPTRVLHRVPDQLRGDGHRVDGHRDLFALIRRMDRNLVWLNILYLFPLSLLPFGAALISRHQLKPVVSGCTGSS